MKEEKISYLVKVENEKEEKIIWEFNNKEEVISEIDRIKKSDFWKRTNSKIIVTKKVVIEEVTENIEV